MLDRIGIGIVVSFIILSFIYLFSTVAVYEIGEEKILAAGLASLNNSANSLGIDNTSKAIINNIDDEYANLYIPYDLGFLILLVVSLATSFGISYKAESLSVFDFLGALTLGMIFFLFTFGIIESVSNWFYDNFIFGFLEFDIYANAPLMAAFIDNMNIFAFLWALALLFINRMSNNIEQIRNRGGGFEE